MKYRRWLKTRCYFIKESRYYSAFLFILDQNKENVKKRCDGAKKMAFAPFAPMLWLSIVFSVICAVTGIGTAKAKEN